MDKYYLVQEEVLSRRVIVFGDGHKTAISQWPTNGDITGEPERKAKRLCELLNEGVSFEYEEVKFLIADGIASCRRYADETIVSGIDAKSENSA